MRLHYPIRQVIRSKKKFLNLIVERMPVSIKTFLASLAVGRNSTVGRVLRRFFSVTYKMGERIVEHPFVLLNLELEKGSILDVGCYENPLPMELASLEYDVYGIDIHDYPVSHPNFHFTRGDIMNMPFRDNSFDRVIAVSTIEHIGFGAYGDPIYPEGDIKAMEEIRRVLKEGGMALITLPYYSAPEVKRGWHGKIHVYTEERIKDLTRFFKIEKMDYYIKVGQYYVKGGKRGRITIISLKLLKTS